MADFRKELIKYGKLIYAQNLVMGTGGNISVRIKNKVYIKASRVSLESSAKEDYNEVDLKTGKTICLRGPCSIELPMHLACYKARSDIGSVVHTHPIYGTVLSLTEKRLKSVSYEFKFTVKSEVPVINYKEPGSVKLAAAVREAIKKHNAVLLKNHGAIVVGKDIKEATERSIALERACKIYVLAKLAGRVPLIPQS